MNLLTFLKSDIIILFQPFSLMLVIPSSYVFVEPHFACGRMSDVSDIGKINEKNTNYVPE